VQRPTNAASAGRDLAWDDVRLFLALCRAKTVGRAAKALGIDASTVSRRLAALEEALATTLFDRGRDGIAKTKAAEDLLPLAERIEDGMGLFASAAERLERAPSGLVRLTCPPDVADVLVAPLVSDLLARHPAIRLEIDPAEAVLDLTRHEADLALRTVRPVRGDLVVTRLTTTRWVLAASPARARAIGVLRAWNEAPWIGWGARLASIGPARWLEEHAPAVDPVVRSDSFRVQLSLVGRGVGVALVPELSVEHYGLVPVALGRRLNKDADAWPREELFLVTHRALRDVPRVRAVWELLSERVADRGRRSEQ